jgi:hypothetical protein
MTLAESRAVKYYDFRIVLLTLCVDLRQAKSGGDMSSSGFASRAQSAGDRNAKANNNQGGNTNSGSGQTQSGQKK